MKKKVLSLALIAMSLVGLGANAQTTATASSEKAQQECSAQGGKKCDKQKGERQGRKADGQGKKDGQGRKGGKQGRVNPFDGMNLTEAQQAQLQQLGEKQKAARQQQMQAAKADKQRNDSVRSAARLQAKKDYLQEVKAIIGPDQYVVFLENAYVNAGPGQKAMGQKHDKGQKGDKQHAKKGDKQGKKDKKGQKGDKQHAKAQKQGKSQKQNA